jgi:hypothetical protein
VILRGRLAERLAISAFSLLSAQKLRPDKSRRVKNRNVGPNFSLIRYACRPAPRIDAWQSLACGTSRDSGSPLSSSPSNQITPVVACDSIPPSSLSSDY